MVNHRRFEMFSALNCCFVFIFAATLAVRTARADQAPAQTPTPVQFNIPADAPVRIVHFAFDRSPAGMTAFHYDVQNVSGQGLVAVEIRWQAEFGEQAGSAVVNRDDRWLTGQLAAGASEHFQVTNVASVRATRAGGSNPQPSVAQSAATAEPMTRLVADLSYAELEDGSRLGTNSAQVGHEIDKARHSQITATGKLLNAFGTSGGEGLTHALEQGSAAGAEDSAAQELNARMLGLLRDQGLDAAVLELQRISALSVPESRD
jgi:hypothetical protein